jgi:hypothetical protein
MDLQAAVTFPFKDPDWVKKSVVGSLLVLLSFPLVFLGVPILYGWAIRIARNVAAGQETGIPPWSDLSSYFLDGFKLWLASMIWTLPAVAGAIVFVLASSAAEGTSSEGAITIAAICALPFFFIFLVIGGFSLPLQLAVLAQTSSFASTVNPVAVFKVVRQAPTAFLAAWLISVGVQYALPYVGSLFCLVGMLPAMLYLYAIWGHVAGQAILRRSSPRPMLGDAS